MAHLCIHYLGFKRFPPNLNNSPSGNTGTKHGGPSNRYLSTDILQGYYLIFTLSEVPETNLAWKTVKIFISGKSSCSSHLTKEGGGGGQSIIMI